MQAQIRWAAKLSYWLCTKSVELLLLLHVSISPGSDTCKFWQFRNITESLMVLQSQGDHQGIMTTFSNQKLMSKRWSVLHLYQYPLPRTKERSGKYRWLCSVTVLTALALQTSSWHRAARLSAQRLLCTLNWLQTPRKAGLTFPPSSCHRMAPADWQMHIMKCHDCLLKGTRSHWSICTA